jgi:hypothetical protein
MSMPSTRHASERTSERGIELHPSVRARVDSGEHVAVRLRRLGSVRGSWLGSQGDWEWAVYRGGRLVTVFRRRASQPSTPQALGVSRVIL